MSRIICITGGIGSGKSIVASILEILGIPVYHADTRAKSLYSDEPAMIRDVVDIFGEQILDSKGHLQRNVLAGIVFNDSQKLAALNAIVHPYVRRDFEKWKRTNRDKKTLAREAAILFESGTSTDCDIVIAVSAPLEIRVSRVQKRDKASETEIMARIAQQWSSEKIASLSDYNVVNDDKELILPQILEIIRKEKLVY